MAATPAKQAGSRPPRIWRRSSVRYLAGFCILAVAAYIFLALFQPGLQYKISQPPAGALDSENFRHELEALVEAKFNANTTVEVIANGENFYAAELAAIRAAQHNINLEAYIFHRGKITDQVIAALTERARAGVRVNLNLDALGSLTMPKYRFRELRQAGGNVQWYHQMRWYSWPRYNNRTHRELTVIDGRVAFLGGAGFSDQWIYGKSNQSRWRDTMFSVRGDSVASLQGTFVENWVQSAHELLTGKDYFPFESGSGKTLAMVVNSSPSMGGSTPARILFQALVASARKSIVIATPYFLPDHSLRGELVRAIKERGVQVRILTPGEHTDHFLTRRSSRRLYGDLLAAGAKIYEYQASMIHSKILIVDGLWSVVGSTNFDSRSFGLNDEVNLAALDPALAQNLEKQFADDLEHSRAVSYDEWSRRSYFQRAQEYLGWLIERQE